MIGEVRRQFKEIQATLLTDRADVAATLRSITLNMSDPVADRLVGEVWPNRIETVGSRRYGDISSPTRRASASTTPSPC